MKIQMVNLQEQYQKLKAEIDTGIHEVLETNSYVNGPAVEKFSRLLGSYLDSYVIPCGNGTDALQIAMMSLRLQKGDEIIVPSHTYVASVEVIALLGLTPVFVDVDPNMFTLDLEQVASAITTKTKAIVPVHLYGQCADMETLKNIVQGRDIALIEDTAQALGSDLILADGARRKAGSIGEIGTTSFFPSKSLGCYGDGGAIMTKDQELSNQIKMIGNHGQLKKYCHDIIGVNSRLDSIQAAVLSAKLPHLDSHIEARQNAAKYYDQALNEIVNIHLPKRASYSTHSFHQYTLKIEDGRRDELMHYLASQGIPSVIYYPIPVHLQKAYSHFSIRKDGLPVTEELMNTILSIPMHTELDENQQGYICDNIRKFFN